MIRFVMTALLGFILVFSAAGWSKKGKEVGGTAIPPIIKAGPAPHKIRPENPGGMKIPHRDKGVYSQLAANPLPRKSTRKVERLLPVSETPVASPAPVKKAMPPAEFIAFVQAAQTVEPDAMTDLMAELASERERTLLAQKTIAENNVRLKNLLGRSSTSEAALSEEQKLSSAARRQVQALNLQLVALRRQLARLSRALSASEAETKSQDVQIASLGKRLIAALASKVEELAVAKRLNAALASKVQELAREHPVAKRPTLGCLNICSALGEEFVPHPPLESRIDAAGNIRHKPGEKLHPVSTLSQEVMRQVLRCWSIPASVKYSHTIRVGVRIFLKPDGHLSGPPRVEDSKRMRSDLAFRAVAESALQALRDPRCSPLKLPLKSYETWREISFKFDTGSID